MQMSQYQAGVLKVQPNNEVDFNGLSHGNDKPRAPTMGKLRVNAQVGLVPRTECNVEMC